MDAKTILTMLKTALDGHNRAAVAEELKPETYLHYLDLAALELVKELETPVVEDTYTLEKDKRAVNLDRAFLDFKDEFAIRLDPNGHDSEGCPITIVPNSSMIL